MITTPFGNISDNGEDDLEDLDFLIYLETEGIDDKPWIVYDWWEEV